MEVTITRYVVGFLFDPNHINVALIRKNRPDWQRGFYNGIGGHIEEGESPSDAITREFEEETGVKIDLWEEFCVLSGDKYIVHCYKSNSNKIQEVASKTDEMVIICGVDDLVEYPIISNLKWLIPMALDPYHKHSTSYA